MFASLSPSCSVSLSFSFSRFQSLSLHRNLNIYNGDILVPRATRLERTGSGDENAMVTINVLRNIIFLHYSMIKYGR